MLCPACVSLLEDDFSLANYTHHSKECVLWPFGFEERLSLFGLYQHSLLRTFFSSYKIHVVSQCGVEKEESLLSFFDSLSVCFSPLPCFSSLMGKLPSLPLYYLASERSSKFLCSLLASGWMKRSLERYTVRWKSPEIGWGLFARDSFGAGEMIGVYSGLVQYLPFFCKTRDLSYTAELVRPFLWNRPFVVDAKQVGSIFRFMNHDVRPNVQIEYVRLCSLPFLIVSTTRAIRQGEELTISYGSHFSHRWKLMQSNNL